MALPEGKLLLVRMDKIGDLVLTLTADQAPQLQGRECRWLISQGTGFVPEHAVPKRIFQEADKAFSLRNFLALVKWFKDQQFNGAIVFYAPWWLGLALCWARVPVRIGRLSQWHSFLFFNQGIRQRRSQGEFHESDYNLQIIEKAAGVESQQSPSPLPPLRLQASSTNVEPWNLRSGDYIVVHPGMAGSALNWPIAHYLDLIRNLSMQYKVVVTGTKADRPYWAPLKKALGGSDRVEFLTEKLTPEQLLTVLSQARAVVAPSTGVLHLAASLGTACLGLYSPLKVQRPTRWGPKGPRTRVLMPSVTRQEEINVAPDVMAKISVPDVLSTLGELGAWTK